MAAPKELYVRTKCINQGGSLMKKIIALALIVLVFASCGPRRLGCGPYRRCEIKEIKKSESTLEKYNC